MEANKQKIQELKAQIAQLEHGDDEADRPEIHPNLIRKMADSKASTDDMKFALILRHIKDSTGLTLGQVAKKAGLAVEDTRNIIQEMKKQTIVRSEGSRRATRYYMAGESKTVPGQEDSAEQNPTSAPVVKRRPGRPRKNPVAHEAQASA